MFKSILCINILHNIANVTPLYFANNQKLSTQKQVLNFDFHILAFR